MANWTTTDATTTPTRRRLLKAPTCQNSLTGLRAANARNSSFNTLVFSELFRAFAARSPVKLFWQVGAFSNLRLVGVVVASVVVQFAIHQISALARLFQIHDLPFSGRLLPLLLGLIPV